MELEELDITNHIKWGVGVVFSIWPNENDIKVMMSQMRTKLREKTIGDIYWHFSQVGDGWHFSGNISAEPIGATRESPAKKEVSSNAPLQTNQENFLWEESHGTY